MVKQRREKSNYTGAEYREEQNSDAHSADYQNQKHDWSSDKSLEKFQEALDHHARNGEDEDVEFRRQAAEDFRNEKT